jgi:hypothetical protein
MFKRGNKAATAVLDDGKAHCDLCGARVPVLEDGHCDLGHRLQLAPQPDPSPEATQAEVGPATPPATGEAASPPPSSAAPEERSPIGPGPDEDPFAHPYDEVLAWEDPLPGADSPGQAPAAAEDEPALEDLIAWDEPDAGADVGELAKDLAGLDDEL